MYLEIILNKTTTTIYVYILAEYPRYARFIQPAPAEGYSGAFGPFTLLACGQKKYPYCTLVNQLAPAEGYTGAFGPFSLLGD